MTEEKRRQRLMEWLEAIRKDVRDLIRDDHIFWQVQDISRTNQRLAGAPGLFNQWMARAFVQSTASGVRRQADKGRAAISLYRFLSEIKQHPALVSRAYLVALYRGNQSSPDLFEQLANGDCDRHIGAGKAEPDPRQIEAEIEELLRKTDQVRHYVDRRIAHYDERGLAHPVPKFDDLTDCLQLFERLIKKYQILLKGVGESTLLPTFPFDWKAVFYFAWLNDPNPAISTKIV